MRVIAGERNRGMNGTEAPSITNKLRVFRFGSKGSLKLKCCKTKDPSADMPAEEP